ncbi:MAG TPA: alpha-amylase family glycosyl hydrolase [Trebonia sp.]|nr:alpha-amylase family glycosyl hydrolase [Trebonia sp.]
MSADDSFPPGGQGRPASQAPVPAEDPAAEPWWAGAVVYQVYPRSFADSDGDGTGDLPGLTSRLDYLADLGVDAIWLTPFYPSPLRDGGYDVSDYTDVDPRLGTLADFDALVRGAAKHNIRVIIDVVPNHCSAEHPLFRKALAAPPGSPERGLFIFRDGRGARGEEPPNNWPSRFGGHAWTRVPDGQWYLHLFDSSQPDWNWADPRVTAMFAGILRFWLDRGIGGFRVDVAHGLFKDPDLADVTDTTLTNHPSAYYHRPEVHGIYRSWRQILGSYPGAGFPGTRTAVGEVHTDSVDTLRPYLAPGELPQVFNFGLVRSRWSAPALRAAIDATNAFADGARAPWVIGNHDVVRPVTRWGRAAARAAALLLLALPGSAYVYQGEELGLPEVTDIPDAARQDPAFVRSGGRDGRRDGCRVPLPWDRGGPSFGFSRTTAASSPAAPWLPQPPGWGERSVAAQHGDPGSFLTLYREALRVRRRHPALGTGTGAGGPTAAGATAGGATAGGLPTSDPVGDGSPASDSPASDSPASGSPAGGSRAGGSRAGGLPTSDPVGGGLPARDSAGSGSMRWLEAPDDVLCFARDPGFVFLANLGPKPVPLPVFRELLLASGPLTPGAGGRADGSLPPGTAVWLQT